MLGRFVESLVQAIQKLRDLWCQGFKLAICENWGRRRTRARERVLQPNPFARISTQRRRLYEMPAKDRSCATIRKPLADAAVEHFVRNMDA